MTNNEATNLHAKLNHHDYLYQELSLTPKQKQIIIIITCLGQI